MPIYEYRCEACGHEFEKLVSLSAPPPPCPECASEVKKKVSAASFVLKGGGWYKDHYGLKNTSAKGDGKSEGKTETKTESAPKTDSGPSKASAA